jgi:hypothetical protein
MPSLWDADTGQYCNSHLYDMSAPVGAPHHQLINRSPILQPSTR